MQLYSLAKQIFVEALELPPETRDPWLESRCGADDTLRREVLALLSHHHTLAGFTPLGLDLLPLSTAPPERVGPYSIVRAIGEGGMGRVFLAQHPDRGDVALKLMHGELMTSDLVSRFAREVEILSRLDHPGIAPLLDSGAEPSPRGPRPWLVMEHVRGEPLAEWARSHVADVDRLELLARLGDAIEYAHRQGIVHRDLKPANVIVRPGGSPVLLDFGIARLREVESESTLDLTRTGLLMGTVSYMSPEQASGRLDLVGPVSDQYALAVMAYELLCHRLPYDLQKRSVQSALATVITADPQPLHELRGRRRAWLERVLGRALQKRPEDRHASVADFVAELRRVAANRAPLTPGRYALGSSGRRTRVRSVSFALAGIAVAVIAAATLLLDRAARQDPDRQWPHINAQLEQANRLIQFGQRTPADLEAALRALESARSRLDQLPPQPWTADVRRLVEFRSGEAEYFLASLEMDPARFRRSEVHFRLATRPPRLRSGPVPVPDTTAEWITGLHHLTSTTAHASQAHALLGLSALEGPRSLIREALEVRLEVLRDCERVIRERGGLERISADDQLLADRAFRLNELGESRAALAALDDDTTAIAASIRDVREALASPRNHIKTSAVVSMTHTLGWLFLERGRITSSDSDLDSAATHLQAALDWRLTQARGLSRVHSLELLTRLACTRAALARADAATTRDLEALEQLLARVHRDLQADAHPIHRLRLELLRAHLALELADRTGVRAWLQRADSLLATPSWTPTRKREPVLEARRERELARADHVAVHRFSDGRRKGSLVAHLDNAAYAVPRDQDPVGFRELLRLRAR